MPRTKIFPFLWYAKDAEGAARFYASIFPESRVDRVTALQSESPSGPPGSVKVVEFTLFGQPFRAMSAGPHHEFNDAVSLMVLCDDQAELDRYWNALLEGGGKPQACGWLTDRFGVRWQIVPAVFEEMMRDTNPARSRHVTDSMMKMVKFDIAELEKPNAREPRRDEFYEACYSCRWESAAQKTLAHRQGVSPPSHQKNPDIEPTRRTDAIGEACYELVHPSALKLQLCQHLVV